MPAALALVWCAVWAAAAPDLRGEVGKPGGEAAAPLLDKPPVRLSPPYREMFTSVPMWSIFAGQLCSSWGYYMLLEMLPLYFHEVYHLTLANSAYISVLPFVLRICSMLLAGGATAPLLRRGMRLITVRKLLTSVSMVVPALAFGCVALWRLPDSATVALLCIAVMAAALTNLGCALGPMDIWPSHAGAAFGLANTVGNFAGFLAPLVTGRMLSAGDCPVDAPGSAPVAVPHSCIAAWDTAFFVAAAVSLGGAGAYVVFGGRHPVYRSDAREAAVN